MIKKYFFQKTKGGYTLIEAMISMTLFMVIMTVGVRALLNANIIHQKSQDLRTIMDNLSFIMEDMSRNIRTGSAYRCMGSFSATSISVPESCASGSVLALESAFGNDSSDSDQWVYKVESTDGGVTYNISKSETGGGGGSWMQLNSSEIVLSPASGFSVLGAEPEPGDSQQPFVTIRLVGTITFKNIVTPFSLQTSVSQRLVDIL